MAHGLAQQLAPGDLHPHLIDQCAHAGAAGFEPLAQLARCHFVAALQTLDRLGDLLVLHHHAATLGLLQAQSLIDQLACHL